MAVAIASALLSLSAAAPQRWEQAGGALKLGTLHGYAAQPNVRVPVGVATKLPWAIADAEQPREARNLRLLCETRVGTKTVSFLSLGDRTVLIAAFTDRPLQKPQDDIWLETNFLLHGDNLTAAPYDVRRPSATADWAYVYDQNGDGRIDHLAFLIGPLNIEPPNSPEDLPVADAQGAFHDVQGSRLKKWFAWINKFAFWQAIDDNGDGRMDWLAIPARQRSNGWIRGWAVIPWTDTQSGFNCEILDRSGAAIEPCVASGARDYESVSRTAFRWPLHPEAHFNEAVRGSEACHIGRDQLRRMPPSS